MAKMIKKAQAGAKAQDSTKTYQDSPIQKAKQDKSKLSLEYKQWLKGASTDPVKAARFRKDEEAMKKPKMQNGGSLSGLKASNKRVGPVDPKGAFTKVQKKTLAGAKGKASLTKDKQLGATKMKKK
jgi:hypothetical protein